MKRRNFPEASAIYLPAGTRERLDTIAQSTGMNAGTFMRVAVLDRLKEAEQREEDEQQ